MPDNPEEYNPYYETAFDFATSLSKDDAILAMLGWMKKPFREVPEAEYAYCYEHQDEEEASYKPDLIEILRDSRESAVAAYSNAKFEELADEIIAEKLADIKKCDSNIELAHHYKCRIDDELAKGDSSVLRIDSNATKYPNFPFITIASLDRWAEAEFNIHILDPLPTDTEEDEQEAGSVTSLQITFAFLVELLAETDPQFQQKGKPNVIAIARTLNERATNYKKEVTGRPSSYGQSVESIRKRIDKAINTRNEDF